MGAYIQSFEDLPIEEMSTTRHNGTRSINASDLAIPTENIPDLMYVRLGDGCVSA